ncbi:MAG: glycosyltransferase family 39 protein [Candidatus Fermentibacterota bacterium]
MALPVTRRGTLLKAGLATALSLAARLFSIGSKSLWLDEALALEVARLPVDRILGLPSAAIPHAPLHFLLVKASMGVFGSSEAALRLPSALLSGLAVLPLMLLVARLAGRRAGLWAGLFWGLAPYAVSLGQEAWVYGTLAGLGILFAALSLEVWRGSRRLLLPMLAVAAAGVWTSLLFGLFALAGLGLWATVNGRRRVSPWLPASAAIAIAALALPILLSSGDEMAGRTSREERAGIPSVDVSRAASDTPVVLARLMPGGVLQRPAEPLLAGKKRLLLYALLIGVLVSAGALSAKRLSPRVRLWAAATAVIPLAAQMVEPMGARQLSVLWLPAGLVLGAAASRMRWAGVATAGGMLALLVAYYGIPSFPYHRADWRSAAAAVSRRWREGDRVLVLNRQSGTVWSYYAPEIEARVMTPPQAVRELGRMDRTDGRAWVVKDYWSGMPADEVVGRSGLDLEEALPTGDLMQVVLALPPEEAAP